MRVHVYIRLQPTAIRAREQREQVSSSAQVSFKEDPMPSDPMAVMIRH